jgi:hypothetical protein
MSSWHEKPIPVCLFLIGRVKEQHALWPKTVEKSYEYARAPDVAAIVPQPKGEVKDLTP